MNDSTESSYPPPHGVCEYQYGVRSPVQTYVYAMMLEPLGRHQAAVRGPRPGQVPAGVPLGRGPNSGCFSSARR